MSNAVFLLPLVLRGSLTVQMCFDLVHRRLYLVVGNQINKSVRLKIGDTDGADNAFFVKRLQVPPCGIVIEDVKKYCDLCRKEESGETLRARYEMILNARKDAYARLEEAKAVVAYMEKKVAHYESIIAGSAPDDSNPNTWTKDHKPESHE